MPTPFFREQVMTKGNGVNFELDQLLHPAQGFDHPFEVVNDPDLTLNEKRAILASWASDACAIEAAPELRAGPKGPVRFDDIMDALRSLDKQRMVTGIESRSGGASKGRFPKQWRRPRPASSVGAWPLQ